ncbi:MAG: sugar phosphate isomerase/epimerase [Oscillospiraceae bacterium]|nr:sugar phosphate isomerase/epimerase [Oscillospiraceae bacterium]
MAEIKKTMRIGMMGGFYPVPASVSEDDRIEYVINRSHELGCGVLQLSFVLPEDEGKLKHLGDLAKSYDMDLEVRMPAEIWDLTKDYDNVKKAFDARIKEMRLLNNAKIMRGGYGKLKIDSSRFNKNISIADHMKKVADNLKLAAKIVEDNGVLLAIENHCDFKGPELAKIFDEVGSKSVGCAMDTANGFTVFYDPNEEVEILAPYALTTHVKDMVIQQDPINGRTPFFASGCALGDGHVDIPRALDVFAEKAPHPENMHIIIETGWHDYAPDTTQAEKDAFTAEVFHKSIKFLKKHLYGQE